MRWFLVLGVLVSGACGLLPLPPCESVLYPCEGRIYIPDHPEQGPLPGAGSRRTFHPKGSTNPSSTANVRRREDRARLNLPIIEISMDLEFETLGIAVLPRLGRSSPGQLLRRRFDFAEEPR